MGGPDGCSGLTVFGDDAFCGGVDHFVYFVIARFGSVPGVGDVFVFARMDLVHQEFDFGGVKFGTGYAAHIVYDVAGHGVYFVKALKVSGREAAGTLTADVEAVVAGYFLREVMGGFADVVAVGAGAVDGPVEAGGAGFFFEDAFRQGAAADVAEADHEKGGRGRFFHGREGTESGGSGAGASVCGEGDGDVGEVSVIDGDDGALVIEKGGEGGGNRRMGEPPVAALFVNG